VRPGSPGGLIFGLKVATRDQPFPSSLSCLDTIFDRLESLQQPYCRIAVLPCEVRVTAASHPKCLVSCWRRMHSGG
jgi:hypothetical protein